MDYFSKSCKKKVLFLKNEKTSIFTLQLITIMINSIFEFKSEEKTVKQ